MQSKQYNDMFLHEKTHWWFRGKRAYIETLLKNVAFGKLHILDIGAGTGYTTKFLERFGAVTGIEQNRKACRLAKKNNVNVVCGSANNLPFKDHSFHCVTILDVLYHKGIKTQRVMKEARRVLKKGGYVLITDCVHPSLYSDHDRIMQARERFSKNNLEQQIIDCGFAIAKSSYLFTSTFPAFVMARILVGHKKDTPLVATPHRLINVFLFTLLQIESLLLKHINLPFGSSVIILAQKT